MRTDVAKGCDKPVWKSFVHIFLPPSSLLVFVLYLHLITNFWRTKFYNTILKGTLSLNKSNKIIFLEIVVFSFWAYKFFILNLYFLN